MNTIKCNLMVAVCSVGVVMSQSSVAADTTRTANVAIDWSQLHISVTGVDGIIPGVTFSNQYTSLYSSASVPGEQSENNSKSVYNWTSDQGTNADAGTTFANTAVSSSTLSATAQAVNTDSPYWNTPGASSSGNRTENFSFDGPGVLTVTVPYTLNIAGGDPYNYWDSVAASINGHAYFYGYEGNGNFDSQSNASFSLHSYYYDHTPQSQSGNLVFGIFASGPGSGSLGIDFSASTGGSASMVPEPESYAMLLAGLGLMGAVIRRRSMGENV
jgi:hypothetical protein